MSRRCEVGINEGKGEADIKCQNKAEILIRIYPEGDILGACRRCFEFLHSHQMNMRVVKRSI